MLHQRYTRTDLLLDDLLLENQEFINKDDLRIAELCGVTGVVYSIIKELHAVIKVDAKRDSELAVMRKAKRILIKSIYNSIIAYKLLSIRIGDEFENGFEESAQLGPFDIDENDRTPLSDD